MKRLIARLVVFILTSLLFLELVFRFIIPASELPASMRGEYGFNLFDPGYSRSGCYSEGIIPCSRTRWVINDDGWNSLFQYEPRENRDRPLIAVFGDSAIEGFLCDVEEHIDTWLYCILQGSFDVYAFGRHNQSLVEMALLMEQVDSLYRPDVFVIITSTPALRNSLWPASLAEYHTLMPLPLWGTFTTVTPMLWQSSRFARTAMRSSLVRYLALNRNLYLFPLKEIEIPAVHTAPLKNIEIQQLRPVAGRYLLTRMSNGLGDRRLLIVTDNSAIRHQLYGQESISDERNIITSDQVLLSELCSKYHNIEYLDSFIDIRSDFDTTRSYYDASDARHLNGYGNYVVASSIARRLEVSWTLRRALLDWEAR